MSQSRATRLVIFEQGNITEIEETIIDFTTEQILVAIESGSD